MKHLLILIILLNILACQNNHSDEDQQEKFFDPKELSELSLENLVGFWENDSLVYFSNFFDNCPAFIGGTALRSVEKSKIIGVATFESQAKAVECMDGRINTVAILIKPGVTNEIFKGKWWYAEGPNSCIFVNQWNTIIEVAFIPSDYEIVKTLLIETAGEIANRIDALSE